jgi:perosamine synthetase
MKPVIGFKILKILKSIKQVFITCKMERIFREIVDFIRKLYNKPNGIIPLHAPTFIGNEKKYLEQCIDTTFVSSIGKFVDRFEEEIAKYTGAKKAVAFVNGTSALHLALKLVGVKHGTEVITQPLTFVATANAIKYCGADPVFLDVDLDTMGLSPLALKRWLDESTIQRINKSTNQQETINKKTKKRIAACLPMHTFGHPCRIDEIEKVCKVFNIPIVEDAAESLGSFYNNQHAGTFGEIGILSFNGNKIITTGGGGMLLFKNENIAYKAKHLSTQAKVPHSWEFIHDEIGYNYRMPNINAALGMAQLEKLQTFLENKRQIANKYKNFFLALQNDHKNIKGNICFISEPPQAHSNYWLNCILMREKEERDALLKYTNDNGIMTRPSWRLMNELKMFECYNNMDLKNARYISDKLVNIPSGIII